MRQRDQKKNPAPKAFGAEFWRRPVDSFAPAHSPATLAGLTGSPTGFPARRVLCSSRRPEIKNPTGMNRAGFLFWRRPTLARPIVALPSGLQRFTSVFGMGTGGATALGSPEGNCENGGLRMDDGRLPQFSILHPQSSLRPRTCLLATCVCVASIVLKEPPPIL